MSCTDFGDPQVIVILPRRLARLPRTIERRVANPLSRRILAGEFAEGDTALVDHRPDGRASARDGEYAFEKRKAPAKAAATAAS